jgi:HAD superfamily hydrolase (TIGR01549 family)
MKHWVFDLDGTLVDSLGTHFQIMEKVFQKFSVDFTLERQAEIYKMSAKTMPTYFENYFGRERLDEAVQFFRQSKKQSYQQVQAFQGIKDLLEMLQARQIKLGVWTARDIESTEQILATTGLKPYFSIYVSGSCVEQAKPHPEGLKKIADHFNCPADEMVMVGDFDFDMQGAQAFGIKGIRVSWHSKALAEKCPIAHWQFAQVDDLKKWVAEL